MGYSPENNPYIPGDPYSYDLKWMVDQIKGWKDPLDSADRAKASEEAAKLSEQQSEAWAVGTIDGEAVPADAPQHDNNSKHWSDEAASSALEAKDYADHIADPVSGIVTTWLADHISNPSNPPLDTSLSLGSAAAEAAATGKAINEATKSKLSDIASGIKGYFNPSDGLTNTNLSINRINYGYMVAGKGSIITLLDDTNIQGFGIHTYDYDGSFIASAGTINSNKNNITTTVDCIVAVSVATTYADAGGYEGAIGQQLAIYKTEPNDKRFVYDTLPASYEFGTISGGDPSGSNPNRIRAAEYIKVGKQTRIFKPRIDTGLSPVIYSLDTKGYIKDLAAQYLPVYPAFDNDYYIKPVSRMVGGGNFSDPGEAPLQATIFQDNSEALPPYYFESSWMDNKIASINSHDADSCYPGDVFAFITDVHWKQNCQRSPLLLDYLSKHTNMKTVIFGGDGITSASSKDAAKEEYHTFRNNFNKFRHLTWYPIIGNHEYNNPGADPSLMYKTLTNSEAYGLVVKEDEALIKNIDECSYYIDNENQKIRYVFIGCDYSALIPNPTQTAVIAAMNATPSGWALMVFSHIGIAEAGTLESSFVSIANALDVIKSAGSVKVIGAITGHTHLDQVLTTTGGVNIIATTSDSWNEAATSPNTRTRATVTEQAFDVVQIDLTNDVIYLTRIGAGNDRTINF